jgi:hypothetical protein
MWWFKRVGVIAVVAVTVAGCANERAIYRNVTLGMQPEPTVQPHKGPPSGVQPSRTERVPIGHALILDGRQRVVISGKRTQWNERQGAVEQVWVHCPDRGVDVYAAAAQGGNLGIGLGVKPDAKDKNLQAALSSNETATALSRRVTTDLIQDQQFRNCLLYQAGAISAEELENNEIRDRAQSFALLAIESLTSMERSSPAITATSEATVATLAAARKAASDTADESKKAAEAYKAAAKKDSNPLTCEGATDVAVCTAKKTESEAAAAKAKEAKTYYDALLKLVDSGAPAPPAAAKEAEKISAAGVSDAVLKIVHAAINSEAEDDMFCRRALLRENLSVKIETICLARLANTPVTSDAPARGEPPKPPVAEADGAKGKPGAGVPAVTTPAPEGGKPEAPKPPSVSGVVGMSDPRIFIQIARQDQGARAKQLISRLRASAELQDVRVLSGIELRAGDSPRKTQIRYFYAEDKSWAEKVLEIVKKEMSDATMVNFEIYKARAGKGLIEIWIGAETASPP